MTAADGSLLSLLPNTPTMPLADAFRLMGYSRNGGYESVKADRFPIEVLPVGQRRQVVRTADVRAYLDPRGSSPALNNECAKTEGNAAVATLLAALAAAIAAGASIEDLARRITANAA